MHPIEHLRYLARASGADPAGLVRETALALASLRVDPANLVIACRRIVERHPPVGPLWWLCSRLLTADDPTELAWELADAIDDDPTPRAVAAVLPADAVVLTIGWPDVAGAALLRRGDVTVWCADSRHTASSFLQRLERHDIACEPVPAELVARAASAADLVLVDAVAACADRVFAPVGSHVVAAVAASVGTPVWLVAGLGCRLPGEYVGAIGDRVVIDRWHVDAEIDDLPIDLVTHVVTADGLADRHDGALRRADCAFAPELLRTSAV